MKCDVMLFQCHIFYVGFLKCLKFTPRISEAQKSYEIGIILIAIWIIIVSESVDFVLHRFFCKIEDISQYMYLHQLLSFIW
jgi:hypothetical protein